MARLLYISTRVWVLHTPSTGQNMRFHIFQMENGKYEEEEGKKGKKHVFCACNYRDKICVYDVKVIFWVF